MTTWRTSADAAAAVAGTGLVVQVTGCRPRPRAISTRPLDASTSGADWIVVRADSAGESRLADTPRLREITVPDLSQLQRPPRAGACGERSRRAARGDARRRAGRRRAARPGAVAARRQLLAAAPTSSPGLVPVVCCSSSPWVLSRITRAACGYTLGRAARLRAPGRPGRAAAARALGRADLRDDEPGPAGHARGARDASSARVPPVEASGTLMLLPYSIGFAAALPAAWLALATPRPLAPALPVVLSLAATIPLGVLVPDHYVLRGVAPRRRARGVGRGTGPPVRVARRGAARRARWAPSQPSWSVALDRRASSACWCPTTTRRTDPADPRRTSSDRPPGRPTRSSHRRRGGTSCSGRPGAPEDAGCASPRSTSTTVRPGCRRGVPGAGRGSGRSGASGRDVTPLRPGPDDQVRVRIRPAYASDWLPDARGAHQPRPRLPGGAPSSRTSATTRPRRVPLVVGGVDPRDDYTFTSVLADEGLPGSDAAREATRRPAPARGRLPRPVPEPFDRDRARAHPARPAAGPLPAAQRRRPVDGTVVAGADRPGSTDCWARDRIIATPFQYAALTALGASRLGVPGTGGDRRRAGTARHRRHTQRLLLGRAAARRRHLAHPRPGALHRRAPIGEDEADERPTRPPSWPGPGFGRGRWRRRRGPGQVPKGADIELPAGLRPRGGVPPVAHGGRWRSCRRWDWSCWPAAVPIVKVVRRRRRRRTASWSGLVRQRLAGGARHGPGPRHPGPRGMEPGRPGIERSALGVDLARRADAAVFAPGPGDVDEARDFWDACQECAASSCSMPAVRRRWWAASTPPRCSPGGRAVGATGSAAPQVRHEDRRTGSQQPTSA